MKKENKTSISKEERKGIKKKHGSKVLTIEEWNKEMNKHDDKSKYVNK